jgi:two-component system, chemotaxis family, chemotaxis protein CheY
MTIGIWRILQAVGVRTTYEARNGEDAWRLFLANPCDVIFLDWVMEGLSGLDFTAKARIAPDSANAFVPILMLSGYTSIERAHAARDAGVNEFLAKPVSPKTILDRMFAVIEHLRPFVRTKAYLGPCRRRRWNDDAFKGTERRITESNIVKPEEPSANAA